MTGRYFSKNTITRQFSGSFFMIKQTILEHEVYLNTRALTMQFNEIINKNLELAVIAVTKNKENVCLSTKDCVVGRCGDLQQAPFIC